MIDALHVMPAVFNATILRTTRHYQLLVSIYFYNSRNPSFKHAVHTVHMVIGIVLYRYTYLFDELQRWKADDDFVYRIVYTI